MVPKRPEQDDIVATPAAGDEGSLTVRIGFLGGRDEVGALGEQVGEGDGGAPAVPWVEGVLVEVVPGGTVGGEGLGGEGIAEDVGVGGVGGGTGHCGRVDTKCWLEEK